jgi:hypothetical protein
MNSSALDQVVNAVLYEGYVLYPYRASSTKNQRERFTFGRVYPEWYSLSQRGAEPCQMQTECLLESAGEKSTVLVTVRFLQPMAREVGLLELPWADRSHPPVFRSVPELRIVDEVYQSWHEAIERRICLPPLELSASTRTKRVLFEFPAGETFEPLRKGDDVVGAFRRVSTQVQGAVEAQVQRLEDSVFKISVRVLNQTPLAGGQSISEMAVMQTFASTHTTLTAQDANFISLMDPEPHYRQAAESCRNQGAWPVLIGDAAQRPRDTMLSSPIILYDYPQIAGQSPGPLFDGTEIDEIVTLRVLTLTDSEKKEMRLVDEQARRILERTESLDSQQFWSMHGTLQQIEANSNPIEFDDFFGANLRLESVKVGDAQVGPGSRVRICPKNRADLMDLALAGRVAVVESVEQDVEGKIHLAVVFEEDPGKDLGLMRQPGHRFFYGVEEVELLTEVTP